MRVKLIICLVLITMTSLPAAAGVKLDTLLTTEGLNQRGEPVTVKRSFSLKEEQGVQFYVEWNEDNQEHDVAVRWFGPQNKLINFLYLANFSENIVRDYISFEQETATQYFIPQQQGEYSIQLYLDHQLVAVSNFRIE